MNKLIEDIRKSIIGETAITNYIYNHFYPGHLVSIKNPIYPCANIEFDTGGYADEDIPKFQVLPCSINSYSRASANEASAIYDLIFDFLQKWLYRDTDRMFIMQETMRPVQLYDDIDKVYYQAGKWVVKLIKRI